MRATQSSVRTVASVLAACAVLTSGVNEAHADAREQLRPRRHVGLQVSGATVLSVGYLLQTFATAWAGPSPTTCYDTSPCGSFPVPFDPEPAWAPFVGVGMIPVAGPWVQLVLVQGLGHPDTRPAWTGWLIANGVMQAGGLALLLAGLFAPTPVDQNQAWLIVPSFDPSTAQMTFVGTW
jgi:hypothetical protein